jgi:hypothetical protein
MTTSVSIATVTSTTVTLAAITSQNFTNVQNGGHQERQAPNGEAKIDEVVTVQPPTYEEAVSMDQPVTTQPQVVAV